VLQRIMGYKHVCEHKIFKHFLIRNAALLQVVTWRQRLSPYIFAEIWLRMWSTPRSFAQLVLTFFSLCKWQFFSETLYKIILAYIILHMAMDTGAGNEGDKSPAKIMFSHKMMHFIDSHLSRHFLKLQT